MTLLNEGDNESAKGRKFHSKQKITLQAQVRKKRGTNHDGLYKIVSPGYVVIKAEHYRCRTRESGKVALTEIVDLQKLDGCGTKLNIGRRSWDLRATFSLLKLGFHNKEPTSVEKRLKGWTL